MESLVDYLPVEPVGHAFLTHYLRHLIYTSRDRTVEQSDEEKQRMGMENINGNLDMKNKKSLKKSISSRTTAIRELEINFDWNFKKEDLYAVLGLKKYQMNCTCDEIKASYKKIQALCHPDKYTDEIKQKQAQERFQLLEHAYETLSHDVYKKLYDSKIEFDDSIPNDIELHMNGIDKSDFSVHRYLNLAEYTGNDKDDEELINKIVESKCRVKNRPKFYEYFGKYFEKFAAYSNKKPVPSLGDDSTSDAKVLKFYKFWDNFSSWRDFTHLCDPIDIYDLTYAENNSEWKWMKKHNDKKQEKYKLQEKLTISKLVQLCKERDPRLIRIEEKERRAIIIEEQLKEKRRQEREEEQMRKEQEIEEKRRQKEEERLQELRKQTQEKDRIRREIQQLPIDLRKLLNKPFFRQQNIPEKNINCVCFHGTREELKVILQEFQKSPEKQLEKFNELLQVCKQRENEKKSKEEQIKKEKELNKFGTSPWSIGELKHLTKLCMKHPRGTENRWEVIYKEFMKKQKKSNNNNDNTNQNKGKEETTPHRSLEELIATAHELQKGNLKMPSKKESSSKKSSNINISTSGGGAGGGGDNTSTSTSTSTTKTTKTLTPLEKELQEIRMRYDTDVTDESWAKAQSSLETVLRELMPIKKEKEWSMETFWEEISKRLREFGKSSKECEERFKYVREVLICKKKYTTTQ